MPRIRCLFEDCVFLVKGYCNTTSVELDPEDGCLTYSEDPGDLILKDYKGDDEEIQFDDTWEDAGFEEIDGLDFENDEGY
jgi:hypothetical protein